MPDDQKRKWQHLAEEDMPDDGGPARVKRDNDEMMQRAQDNIGVPVIGRNGQPVTVTDQGPGGLTWQVRRLPDGNTIRYRDSNTDGKFWTWDADGGKREQWMVGDSNYANIEALRTDLAQHPENPYFRSMYPNSYANASPGELNARRFLRDNFTNGPINQGDMDQIRTADTTRKLMQQAEGLFVDLKGKENLNQIAQGTQNFRTKTDWDNWMGQGTAEQQAVRKKYMQLATVLQQLKGQGLQIGSTPEEQGKAGGLGGDKLTETMLLLSKGSPVGALLATAGSTVIDTAKNLAGSNFKSDELAAQLPALHDQLARAEAQKVQALAGPGSRTYVPKDYRIMGNDAMKDLESHDLGPDDVSTRVLPTYGTSDVKPTPTPAATPAAATAATPTDDAIAKSVARGDMTQKEADAMRARIAAANKPAPTATPAAQAQEPEKGAEAKATPVPVTPAATPVIKAAPLGPVPTTGAPSESGQEFGGQKAATAPAYTTPPYPAAAPPPSPPPGPTSTAEEFANQPGAYTIPPAPISRPGGNPAQAQTSGELPIITLGRQAIDWLTKPSRQETPLSPKESSTPQKSEEKPKPSPVLTPGQWGRPIGELSQDAESGAPLGAPNDAPGVNRLHQQEHVDALAPGTPFYWRDHPDAYVRV